jgi:CubicO group peptidase (beta-lactamase class C family)
MRTTRRGFLTLGSAGALSLFLKDHDVISCCPVGGFGQQPVAVQSQPPIQRQQPAGASERAGMDPAGVDKIVGHFADMIGSGAFRGAQLAVYRHGELVLELAGGVNGANKPVELTSLLGVLSVSKALTAMVMHTLHERGVFQYEDRVARHWPEFGRKGKDEITIAQVMSHRAGLVEDTARAYLHWREWIKPGGEARLVEAMEPKWKPGTANGYHGQSFGQVCNELVIRWTKKNTGEWLRSEICGPLGIDDVYIGLPEALLPRFAPFEGKPSANPLWRPPTGGEKHFFNAPQILKLCLAWGSGVARAGDLARLMNIYAYEGSFGGKTFFSKETFALAITPTNKPDDVDRVLHTRPRWGLGLIVGLTEGTLKTPGYLFGRKAGPRTCGHLGGNSALAWADPDLRLAMGFISTEAVGKAHYEALSDLIRAACKA